MLAGRQKLSGQLPAQRRSLKMPGRQRGMQRSLWPCPEGLSRRQRLRRLICRSESISSLRLWRHYKLAAQVSAVKQAPLARIAPGSVPSIQPPRPWVTGYDTKLNTDLSQTIMHASYATTHTNNFMSDAFLESPLIIGNELLSLAVQATIALQGISVPNIWGDASSHVFDPHPHGRHINQDDEILLGLSKVGQHHRSQQSRQMIADR